MEARANRGITRLHFDGYSNPFPGYPAATKAGGLLFLSGVRGGRGSGRLKRFDDLPEPGRKLKQGYFLADMPEAEVAADAWVAHANLDYLLAQAGSADDRLLRQHIWQKDKRWFPVYETTRMQWQVVPPPSSGIGVAGLAGGYSNWYGITGIATLNEPNSPFGERRVLAGFDNKGLPSASFYSQAVASGPLAFLAGHIPVKTHAPGKPVVRGYDDIPEEGRFLRTGRSHPDSRNGPIAAQAWYCFDEIRKLLSNVGASMSDLLMLTVFLQDLRDFPTYHRIHRHFFPTDETALSVMGFNEVGHRGTLIEIEPTVLLPNSGLDRRRVAWPGGSAPFAAQAACAAGPIVFFSGTLGYDDAGNFPHSSAQLGPEHRKIAELAEMFEVTPGMAAQSVLAIERLKALASATGVDGLGGMAKMHLYVAHPRDFFAFDEVRRLMNWELLPAIDVVAVQGPGPVQAAKMQIEAIGYRSVATEASA